MVMEMNVSAQCIRMHGNRVLNFTDLFKYMQKFKKGICEPIQLGMKRQGALCDLKGWFSNPSNLECLYTILKSIF